MPKTKNDSKVKDFIGCSILQKIGDATSKLYNSHDYIGIEIELENCKHISFYSSITEYFTAVIDGSLKYKGIELRFNKALNGTNITNALELLEYNLKKYKIEPYTKGNRGSTHVHLNVGDLSIKELYNILLLSYFCEPILLDTCHQDRLNSSFGVTSSKTKDQITILKDVAQGHLNFNERHYKYRAIGLNSMFHKGSLEFRMFHATADTKEILQWINFIQEIKHKACEIDDINGLLCSSLQQGINKILEQIFERKITLSPRANHDIWTFVRDLEFNPIEELNMENSISSFYKESIKVHK